MLVFADEEQCSRVYELILNRQGYIGDILRQYRHLGDLGKGGHGNVFLVEHKFSLVRYAMKVIRKRKIDSIYDQTHDQYQELETLLLCTRLGCSNVIELVQSFEDEKRLYLVT